MIFLVAACLGLWASAAHAVDIHGHRGARGLLPENTLPAFEKAIALGVDVLELDTGVTADGTVVVLHDRSLSADLARIGGAWITTPVPVHSLTHAELHAVDVGRIRPDSRTARRLPDQQPVDGTPIPTLAEVLSLGKSKGPATLLFNIETKISPLAPDETLPPLEFAKAVMAVIRDVGVEDRAIIQSFDWRTLAEVKRHAPEIRTAHLTAEQSWLNNVQTGQSGPSPWLAGFDIDDVSGSVPKAIKIFGGDIWSPYFRDLTDASLAEAHALGLEVHVWTVNEEADMRRMAAMGVDGIITDYPDLAIRILRP